MSELWCFIGLCGSAASRPESGRTGQKLPKRNSIFHMWPVICRLPSFTAFVFGNGADSVQLDAGQDETLEVDL